MSARPADYVDLVGWAFIALDGNGGGEIAFGALQAGFDCSLASDAADFEWCGFDEMDEVSGDRFVKLQPD